MNISVIICTFNRAHLLAGALESFFQMETRPDLAVELVVVDNNSSDHTRAAIREYEERFAGSVRYLHEGKQGLSHARNAGIEAARGEVIAFADDDVFFDRQWLLEVVKVFREHPQTAALGGRSIPLFEDGRPPWVSDSMLGWYGSTRSGDQLKTMTYPEHPFGLNMAVRRAAFEKIGVFSGRLGRTRNSLLSNEEADFFGRLHQEGLRVTYTPHAVVRHRIGQERTTRKWILRRNYWQGISDVALSQLRASQGRLQLLKEAWWELGRATRGLPRTFEEWAGLAYRLGRLRQYLREAIAWRSA